VNSYDKTWRKDPNAVLPYTRIWTDWLTDGDTIATSTWTASDPDITIDTSTNDDTTTTAWLSGGTAGETYLLTNRITTTNGYTEDRTFRILVRER